MRLHVDCNIDERVLPLLKLLVKFGNGFKHISVIPEDDEDNILDLIEDNHYGMAFRKLTEVEKKWVHSTFTVQYSSRIMNYKIMKKVNEKTNLINLGASN